MLLLDQKRIRIAYDQSHGGGVTTLEDTDGRKNRGFVGIDDTAAGGSSAAEEDDGREEEGRILGVTRHSVLRELRRRTAKGNNDAADLFDSTRRHKNEITLPLRSFAKDMPSDRLSTRYPFCSASY